MWSHLGERDITERHEITMERPIQLITSASWSNAQLHQATGMVIAQTGATAEEALSRLIHYSNEEGLSLDEVAANVLATKISFA